MTYPLAPLKDLISTRFVREVHGFLWLDGALVDAVVDIGWSCRDHALVLGVLLGVLGYRAMLAHGRAAFGRQSGAREPVTVLQSPHQWVWLDGIGPVDLSIKPSFTSAGVDYRLDLAGVYGRECLPLGRGRVAVVNEADAFERALPQLAAERNHRTALYWMQEVEHVHGGHVTHSPGWIRSPLTGWLDDTLGDPAARYAALILHLEGFLQRARSSLVAGGAAEAWRRLGSGGVDDPVAEVQARLARGLAYGASRV